jgi:hypothetical protein
MKLVPPVPAAITSLVLTLSPVAAASPGGCGASSPVKDQGTVTSIRTGTANHQPAVWFVVRLDGGTRQTEDGPYYTANGGKGNRCRVGSRWPSCLTGGK